jgi:hypothetical protein
MVLRTIGYTDNASVLVGQWPANYIALGQNLILYENVSNDLQMNKASAAQMIYNVLTKQLVQVDANSTVSYLWDRIEDGTQKERSLLTTGLNCYADNEGNKKVVTEVDAARSKINLLPKVGAYGILYKSNVDDEVVALTNVETKFLAGRFMFKSNGEIDVFQSADGTKYTLAGGSTATWTSPKDWAQAFNSTGSAISAPAGNVIFLNGDTKTSLTKTQSVSYVVDDPDGIGNTAAKNQAAFLNIAAKVSGLTITDLRSVAIWVAENKGDDIKGDTFLYAAGQIDGKKFNGHDFPLDVNNEVDDYGYVLAGVNSLDDLASDNVVYLYKNDANKISRIDVGTETQSGTVTNVNKADFVRTIGGRTLAIAPYDGHNKAAVDTAGNEGTALLDIYDRIYDFQLGEASKGNFAVYLAHDNYLGATQVKIFDKTGKEVIYNVTDTATINTLNGLDEGALIEYKISAGKLSEVTEFVLKANSTPSGKVNTTGSILTIGSVNHMIDSGVLVYIKDGSDYSLGSIKDLKDIDRPFWFIKGTSTESKGVGALIVDANDAGAQSVFVMINSVSKGWDNGDIDVVTGLSFADGANAASKSWNYVASTLISTDLNAYPAYFTGTDNRGHYNMMVKFRIDESGVLKSATLLNTLTDKDNPTNPVKVGTFRTWNPGGSDGSFSINTTVSAVDTLITFEANAVLYKIVGGSWTAMRASEGNFKADDIGTLYTFLKTDLGKAYDVIIKNP